MFGFNIVYSQNITEIRGIVKDFSTREPIEFVNISVANSMTGTSTDSLGRFAIKVFAIDKEKLIISHISYYKTVIVLNDSMADHEFTVYMNPKVEQLKDVVVSA